MKVGVFCRDTLLREGLCSLIASLPLRMKLSATGSWSTLLKGIDEGDFDVVLASIEKEELRDFATLEAAKGGRRAFVIAVVGDASLSGSLESIADLIVERNQGFEGLRKAFLKIEIVAKQADAVKEAKPRFGLPRTLTPREREVANLVSQGLPNRTIALTLGIQEQTVKNLVSAVLRKLDCVNRTQLALQLSTSTH